MTQRTFSVLLLATLVSAPATAEDLKTYIWRDADGKVHYGDSPPRHEDYEEKMIPVDSNTVAAERAPAGSGRSVVDDDDNEPRGSSSDPERGLTPEDIADIAEEQQRQLGDDDAIGDEPQGDVNANPEFGADTATSAETALSGGTAAGSGTAAAGGTAAGGTAAAGAALTPPPPPPAPVVGP